MESAREKSEYPRGRRTWEVIDFLLRVLAIATSLVAAVVMGRNKQTVLTPLGLIPAKYHYSPANIYFVVANAIACVYGVFVINNTIANILTSHSSAFSKLFRAFFDLIMVGLLSGALGAAIAIGVVARKGNSHAFWNEICSLYGRFCDEATFAIASSVIAALAFTLLSTFSIYSLYQRASI